MDMNIEIVRLLKSLRSDVYDGCARDSIVDRINTIIELIQSDWDGEDEE